MSEGRNNPREPPPNKSWLHSEPAANVSRRLREQPDYFRRIINDATLDIRERVRRALDYASSSSSEADSPAHVITERDFTFGEIDSSLLPPVESNINVTVGQDGQDAYETDSSLSNASRRGDFSLTSYDTSVFDIAEFIRQRDMTDARNHFGEVIDEEIARMRVELNNNPEAGTGINQTPVETNILQALVDELRHLRIDRNRSENVTPYDSLANDGNLPPRRSIMPDAESYHRVKEARDQIPHFNGSSEERLEEFLTACDYAFKIIAPVDEYALIQAVIGTKLKGVALTEIKNRDIPSYEALKEALEACYAKKKSVTRLQREFNFIRQRAGEDARHYGQRVEQLAHDLFEASTEGNQYIPSEKRGIHRYIKGQALINYQLGLNERLQTIVRSRAPATLAEAVASAVEEERIRGTSGNTFRAADQIPRNRGFQTYTPRENSLPKCQKCGKVGHYGRDCRNSRFANRFTLPKPERTSSVNTTGRYCLHCKRIGHSREECWQLHGKPAERPANNKSRDIPRNTKPFQGDKRPTARSRSPSDEDGATERPIGRDATRSARDYQVHQINRVKPQRTGLDLVLIPIKETTQRNAPLLLDTGSAISFVKVRLLHGDTPITEDRIALTGVTGHRAYTIGRFNATIKLGYKAIRKEFYVVADDFPIDYDGILGVDFLQAHHATCDYQNRKLRIYGKALPLKPYETYYIPARSEMIIRATTNINSIGIITAEEKRPGVFIGNCLVHPKDNSCAVSIINTTEAAVEIATPYVTLEDVSNEDTSDIHMIQKRESNAIPQPRSERLKHALRLAHLNAEERKVMHAICEEFSDLFYLEGDQLTYTATVEHHIITQRDSAPVNVRPYRLPEKHKTEINRQIQEMLSNKIIRQSTSQWNAPLLAVPKKADANGKIKLRIVVDFRKLNDLTIGDSFPLPNITDILDQLGNAKYFTTLDLASGYHQINLSKTDRYKTAFSTSTGHYEFSRMPFGLKNAPATFQRLMNAVLTGLQGIKCLVYLDDIVIYGASLEEHNQRLTSVLQRLRSHKLKLQPEKCEFLRKEVIFLGHVITDKGISPDPSKLTAVQNYPQPKKVKEIQAFIGLAGYYRRFIEGFSKIAKPLTQLTKKEQPFEWTTVQQKAFETLKEKLITAPVLQYPDFNREFILTTDASDYAIGAVLSQGEIGQDRPVAYASRIMSRAEQNYNTTEKELLAIVWAVKHYRPYLYGTVFKIVTDHKPLVWLFNVNDPGSRLIRWRLKLEEYNYKIIHKAGKTNANADALSRNVPSSVNTIGTMEETEEIEPVREYTEEEKQQILYEYHDAPIGGHQGVERTIRRIRLKHNWTGITTDVKSYISKCEKCQKNKLTAQRKSPLIITDTPDKPFEKCALDIVGPLTITENQHRYLLTFQDNLTKFSKAIPIENQEASTIAKEFVTKIILEHGIPARILTDQGTNFLSKIFKNTCKLLKIDKIQTTAYHPQSNGALERSHRTLAEYLRHYIKTDQSDWDEWIPYAMFAYNTTPHTSTGFTPFELMYGYNAQLPTALTQPPKPTYTIEDYVVELRERLRAANQIARENIKEEKSKSKIQYDKGTKEPTFQIGDKVLLHDETVRRGRSKKLDAIWIGPYDIVEKHTNANFTIQRGRKTTRVHANRLKLYIEN